MLLRMHPHTCTQMVDPAEEAVVVVVPPSAAQLSQAARNLVQALVDGALSAAEVIQVGSCTFMCMGTWGKGAREMD